MFEGTRRRVGDRHLDRDALDRVAKALELRLPHNLGLVDRRLRSLTELPADLVGTRPVVAQQHRQLVDLKLHTSSRFYGCIGQVLHQFRCPVFDQHLADLGVPVQNVVGNPEIALFVGNSVTQFQQRQAGWQVTVVDAAQRKIIDHHFLRGAIKYRAVHACQPHRIR